MSIDIGQFTQTFLDESFEGLDVMETHLLSLEPGDIESIDAIFRAAHSIKGGAGTFGFAEVGKFTHGVETLLDQLRAGESSVDEAKKSLLLEAVDCIREMLTAARDGTQLDTDAIVAVERRVQEMLSVKADTADGNSQESASAHRWRIKFVPERDVLRTGNDPLRLISALAELGPVSAQCHDSLPLFEDLDPEECHLAWTLDLDAEVERSAIEEIFEWVEDQAEITIEACDTQAETQSSACVSLESDNKPIATSGDAETIGGSKTNTRARAEGGSIRVNTDKIDALINMVGELVITQSMLSQFGEQLESGNREGIENLLEGLSLLERNTRELQENVMSIRMLPISFVFNRFPRLIHDLGETLEKNIQLKLSGEQTELDKNVLEKISDPLVHLVRNSVDHGIETPEIRQEAGKPEVGTVHLNAFHKGGNIIIEISDDGAGLNRERILAKAKENGLIQEGQIVADEQIYELIFAPGFSTAKELSDVSGRGVGMDVVRRNIRALGGSVEVSSQQGQGSKFTIRLPLTLSILDGQLIDVSGSSYVIPLISIVESVQIDMNSMKTIAEKRLVYKLRDEYIPVISLADVLGSAVKESRSIEESLLVVVEAEGSRLALLVDDLLGQQQVVIKALETNFKKIEGLSGATILGDGTVALILDVSGLLSLSKRKMGNLNWLRTQDHAAA
ncbi:MAG: chemotaxis protein CheA [Pseudohongiellaceae bacterium]|nr:chemotaxis protein CheA [Pseudohongiellaceae bacterium]